MIFDDFNEDYANIKIIIAHTAPTAEYLKPLLAYQHFLSTHLDPLLCQPFFDAQSAGIAKKFDSIKEERKKYLIHLEMLADLIIPEFNELLEKIKPEEGAKYHVTEPALKKGLHAIFSATGQNAQHQSTEDIATWIRNKLQTERCDTKILKLIADIKQLNAFSETLVPEIYLPHDAKNLDKLNNQFSSGLEKFERENGIISKRFGVKVKAWKQLMQASDWDTFADSFCNFFGTERKFLIYRKSKEEKEELCHLANELAYMMEKYKEQKENDHYARLSLQKPHFFRGETIQVTPPKAIPAIRPHANKLRDPRLQQLAEVINQNMGTGENRPLSQHKTTI